MAKIFGLFDADAFYASAELLRRPELRGKPVGILGNHGWCVIAKSQEMKARGVSTGMPIWEARRLVPDGVFIDRDFRWYEKVSRSILDLLRKRFRKVEYYSVDEFFIEMSPFGPGMTWPDTAVAVRDLILEQTGIPGSMGIARSKTVAKMASEASKPFGALSIVGEEETFLASRPVREIPGIGARREEILATAGITNALEYARSERATVRRMLTVVGEQIWYELNGDPVSDVRVAPKKRKSISRGGSFGVRTTDPMLVYGWLGHYVERIVEELEYSGLNAGRIRVGVRYRDRDNRSAEERLELPSDLFAVLIEAAKRCLRSCWRRQVEATHLYLTVDRLTRESYASGGLFGVRDDRAITLAWLKREARETIGRDSLRSGATLPLTEVYRDGLLTFQLSDIRDKTVF